MSFLWSMMSSSVRMGLSVHDNSSASSSSTSLQEVTSSWNGFLTIVLPALVAIGLFGALSQSLSSEKQARKREQEAQLPPMVDEGFWQVLQHFFSPTLPHYLLQISRTDKGPIVRLPLAPPGHVLVAIADPVVARQVLEHAASLKWSHSYQLFAEAFGGPNFFTQEGDRYKHTRKNHSVALGPQFMEQTGNALMQDCLDEWMQQHGLMTTTNDDNSNTPNNNAQNKDGEVFIDISHQLQMLMARIMTKTAFDTDMALSDLEICVQSIKWVYQEVFVDSQRNPVRKWLPWLFAHKRRAHQSTRALQDQVWTMMKNFRQRTDKNDNCLLSLVLQDAGYESDQERCIDLVAYLAGGFETSGYTALWTMLELARNPDIQTKLRHELQRCRDETNNKNKSAAWKDCTYLHHVVKESMRLHPAAAAGSIRVLSHGSVTTPQGHVLPRGCLCLMPFYSIQRNAAVYTNRPDDFWPERWTTATLAMKQAWMSFSLGRRNCKGQLFALTELHMVIAQWITACEWRVVDPGHVHYAVTLKTTGTILAAKPLATAS